LKNALGLAGPGQHWHHIVEQTPGNIGRFGAEAVAHGAVQGAANDALGGDFKDGFLGGFAGSIFEPVAGSVEAKTGSDWAGTVSSAIVGGTVSKIGGGKFANGAASAAFVDMFNRRGHRDSPQYLKRKSQLAGEFQKSIGDAYGLGENGEALTYVDKVRTGGDWDYKSRPEYRALPGIEAFGNFAFGATTAAFADGYSRGLSNMLPDVTTNLALRGAGLYQEYFQKYSPANGHFYDLARPSVSNYGDQLSDSVHITQGSRYYFDHPFRK
jgi:hypothetical protein